VGEDKSRTAILVAAAIIAAVRLAREPIKNSPKVHSEIADSIQLARMIWARIIQERY
jgi:hypothetical protein